jgi:hypothetical protein
MKKYIFSIILLIIGLLIAKLPVHFGDYDGAGLLEVIILGFLGFVYVILFLISCIISLLNLKTQRFNYYPLYTTLFILVICLITYNLDRFKSAPILTAHANSAPQWVQMEYYKDKSFEICLSRIEYSHYLKGNYTLHNDTLILDRNDLVAKTDSLLLTSKYFIDRDHHILYPIINNIINKDSLKILKVDQGNL